jgi:hypothetical protein
MSFFPEGKKEYRGDGEVKKCPCIWPASTFRSSAWTPGSKSAHRPLIRSYPGPGRRRREARGANASGGEEARGGGAEEAQE